MANRIVQAIYDLKDNISAKIKIINDSLRSNQTESDKTAAASEKSGKRISDAYKGSATALNGLRSALAAVAAFAGLDKLKDGIEQVIKAGEDLNDLQKRFAAAFGGLDAGADAFEKIRALAKNVPQTFEDVSDAAIALKKAGFDPLDGSLQALLDNANATNQSQEQLIATIDALGKANIRGAVNIKSLVALTEAGIPVFDLLGKSLGVSADRVRQLAETGQLGQDSIKQLVVQLGKLRAGASSAELGDFDSQLNKLKDTAKEFLETIAQSGALEFFRAQIKELNAEVADAAASGKLQEIAKSISDGIIETGRAVKSTIGFVVEYSGALIELAKTYAIFRTIDLAGSLLKSAAAMSATAKATSAASTEAAAATTTFGKLGKALGGLPTQIKIAVSAAAVDFALTKILELGAALDEQRATEREVADTEADRVAVLQKLADKIATVKTQYAAFANVAIQSGDELKNQSAEQLKAYGDQIVGAERFYKALAAQARTAGDAAGLADAKAHIAALELELIKVNAQLSVTATVGKNAAAGLSVGAAAIVAKLGEIKDDAKATKEFIEKTFEGFDFSKGVVEIGDFAAAFDTVAKAGGKAAEELDATLLESLKKLNGDQLLKFQSDATAAIQGLGKDALATSAILQATLETALDRLGVKAEATGVSITKAGKDSIATFTAIAENAQASAKTIAAAFDAALGNAKTIDEAKALGRELETAANAGKISFEQLSAGARELDERLRTLSAGLTPLASQFDLLGIKSQASLEAARDNAKEAFQAIVDGAAKGTAAQEDVVRAFKAWAEAARAASADSSQSIKDQTEEQIALQASIFNVTDALGKSGDAGKDAGEKTADAFDKSKDSIDAAAAAADDASDKFNKESQAWGDALAQQATSAASAAQGVTLLTNEQLRTLREINQEFLNGSINAEEYARRVGIAFGAVDEQLVASQEAFKKFNSELLDLQSQLAQANGDDSQVEDIRHKQKIADIEAETDLDEAQKHKLEAVEDEIHKRNLERIKEENAAKAAGNDQGAGTGSQTNRHAGGTGNGDAGGGSAGGSAAPTQAPQSPTATVNAIFLTGDKSAAKAFARFLDNELKEIQGRSK